MNWATSFCIVGSIWGIGFIYSAWLVRDDQYKRLTSIETDIKMLNQKTESL
jgi:hypothetical protein